MQAEAFWDLPRSTRPEKLFLEIVPTSPVRLPKATLSLPTNVEVCGTGGGTWSGRLVDGAIEMREGAQHPALCSVVLERGTLREAIAGALRDRALTVMERLGKPRAIPNLSRLPVREDRAVALARLQGSIAIEIADRSFGEVHRVVVTFGDAPPQFEQATTTVRVDADEVVEWIATRADPRAILRGGRVRVEGDLTLPTRALALLLDP
ncbi:MAG: hypothetical protein RIT45_994 [Pseudomonadota bacterium]|jgi:hypothetical protein